MGTSYKTVIELQHAIAERELIAESLYTLCNEGTLGVFRGNGDLVFQCAYRSLQACIDICALLGIDAPQDVSPVPSFHTLMRDESDGLHLCENCEDAYTRGTLCTSCARQKAIDES